MAALIDVVRQGYTHLQHRSDLRRCAVPVTGPLIKSSTFTTVSCKSGCDGVMTVSQMSEEHPYAAKRRSQNVITNFCDPPPGVDVSSRQSREPAYFLTGGFYFKFH